MNKSGATLAQIFTPAVVVSALGYFVDVYDIVLFSVIRITSLKDLGLAPEAILSEGVFLINCQMIGMLVGGLFWGVLGDKLGRIKVLFGSIILYSAANISNGFVHSVEMYALMRFIAGVGLAGEIGAGITLVAETLPLHLRGYGTTMVATIGVAGAVAAGLVGELSHWRTAYIIGGVMGLLLLFLRVSVCESKLFDQACEAGIRKGDLGLLFFSRERLLRYLRCIVVGLPTWFIVGILVTLGPEITAALGAPEAPKPGLCVIWCYVGIVTGDLVSGLLSQYFKSRKKVILVFLALGILGTVVFLNLRAPSLTLIYSLYVFLGFAGGLWVLVLTTSAEQFGTNLRATVTTTVPNMIRGAVVPMTTGFIWAKGYHGIINAGFIIAAVVYVLALLSLFFMRETYWSELDFVEK